MSESSDLNIRDGHAALLLCTAGTMLQMATTARIYEINKEVRVFYSHLSCHCLRLQETLTRAKQTPCQLNGEVIGKALESLGSLVTGSTFQELPASPVMLELQLRMLCLRWNEANAQHDEARLEFIRQWLRPGISEQHRQEVNKALDSCADELDTQPPEHSSPEPSRISTNPDMSEPPCQVCHAAKSIFDALMNCKGCSCPEQHDFKAKLELGTYRSLTKELGGSTIRRRARQSRGGDSGSSEGLELDMFLFMEQDWHEVRVQTVQTPKDKVVRFSLPPEENRMSRVSKNYARVETLCRPIKKSKMKVLQRLLLRLSSDQFFDMGFEKSNFQIDHKINPISLSECFTTRQDFFTEKTKRILSVIIGYTALHLYGTSWLQPGWGSSNIKFFQTTSRKIPLRPFIQAQLPQTSDDEAMDDDDDKLHELDSGHLCPEVVALAVVLLEVHFTMPFTSLAAIKDIPLIETRTGRITLMDVDQVFYGTEEGAEGWRSQIPEDSPLRQTIDNCLNAELWEDDAREVLDSTKMRSEIYRKVVQPLELYLTSGFSHIQLDAVDQYARNLDFGKWGQPMSSQESKDCAAAPLYRQELTTAHSPPPLMPTCAWPGQFAISSNVCQNMSQPALMQPRAACSNMAMALKPNADVDCKTPQFFDDEISDGHHSAVETEKYRRWRAEYDEVYAKFVGSYVSDASPQPVKIAILDTGIDRDHLAFEAREDKLKGKKNCYSVQQKNVPDAHGHGTFTASLILDYAPHASLYIIKIADRENTRPDAKIVANAINHAVSEWNVDIISMSFGWPSSDFDGYDELQDAIDKASSNKVLMFAAASNSGGRRGRAYPASSSNVICVHSTNTNGTRSDFSPTAKPNAVNFATVGESVESAWPMLLCQDEPGRNPHFTKARSGTSYATPILAGIAAFLLQYARLHLSESDATALKRRENMEAILERCAERGAGYQPRDGYFYVHISLDRQNWFGEELSWVNYEISRLLNR